MERDALSLKFRPSHGNNAALKKKVFAHSLKGCGKLFKKDTENARARLQSTSAHDLMSVLDASGLHVTRLKGFKRSNLEVPVNRKFKKIHTLQVARQLSVFVSVASSPSTALQICRIAVDTKEMIGTYLPKTEIGISTVVKAQTTVGVQHGRIITSRLARLIDRPMKRRCAREKSQSR
jgi:hypothetical protein